jgi:membrane protease YdiL (CAAX protease family)
MDVPFEIGSKQKALLYHVAILGGSLLLVAITPINTSLEWSHVATMGLLLAAVIVMPYALSRYVLKDGVITFHFLNGRHWYKAEIAYILATVTIAYLILPFYFANTGAYHNWTVLPGTLNLLRLFIGTQALGLWDELFFINTVLTLLRQHMRFLWANLTQALFWTAFLFTLGFRGWAPPLLYLFALLQGYIFKRTGSLLYIITIHLSLDAVLFLVLVHAYYPASLPIFITH